MAAAFDPTELKNLLECGICLNRFQDPRVLPCLHSYCLECLKSHISPSKDEDSAFNCPQCREKCSIPDGGVDKFPKNFFVNTMKDVLPESILERPPEAAESSGPIMCKHNHQESEDEHGEAVTFCAQCDAHFCQLCTKNHGIFIKDHKVTPVGDTKDILKNKHTVNCELHPNFPINWYCNTCSFPACSECTLEKHSNHDTQKLATNEAALKLDMLDVSKMATKRIAVLQNIFSDVKASETKMVADLDKVSKDISDTADSLCKLIRQHESTLQDHLKQAKQKAEEKFEKAEEDLQRAKDNILRLKIQADALQHAPSEQALCTVLQARITKEQYLHQQDTVVSSVQWSLEKEASQLGKPEELTFLGSIDYSMSQRSKEVFQVEHVTLESPPRITQLEYTGKAAVCNIAPIYASMFCVAHFGENKIWVYSDDGMLQQKVDIPGIKRITGMVAVDEKAGKLALADNKDSKVYFVSLSHDLVMQQKLCREIPIIPYRISVNNKNELLLATREDGRIIVLSSDGKITSDIRVPIPNDSPTIYGIQQTKFGFVICDKDNKKVYLTDTEGHILQTSSACTRPWQALQTSWGHILVADSKSDCVNVLSDAGEILGDIYDKVSTIQHPYSIHISAAKRVLYVGGGPIGAMEVRAYNFAPGDLPPLPVAQNTSDICVKVKIANV